MSAFYILPKKPPEPGMPEMRKLPCGYRHVNLFYGLGATPSEILRRLQADNETKWSWTRFAIFLASEMRRTIPR
jgi:hypothetical protein